MLFTEDGQVWESFVYVPKKPIALNPDGSWNTEKVCELVVKAKAGDEQAIMQLFEQYQNLWKKEITSFVEDMLGYEDAQQEAFYILMRSLKFYDNPSPRAFTNYFVTTLHIKLMEITGRAKDERKQWLFSLDEVDDEGNLIHNLPDIQDEVIPDYSNIRRVLTDFEYKVVIAHYVWEVSFKDIAEHFKLTHQYIRLVNMSIKKKLKVLL